MSYRGTVLTRVLLDEPPRTAIVISSLDYFVAFRPFDTHLEITEAPDVGNLEVTVRRLGDVLAPATVTITTRDGTAQAGADYVPIKQTVSFAPFEQVETIVLQALAKSIFDPDKTFDLILTNASGVEAVSPPVRVTIHAGGAPVGDAPGYNRLTGTLLSGGAMQFSYIGYPATNYALDRTFNLSPPINWVGQQTNTMTVSGVLLFTNTPAPGTNNFWRVHSVP